MSVTVLGSEVLQAPPPPVHDEAAKDTTVVWAVVEAVAWPLQPVPRLEPEQVKLKLPLAALGPLLGAKSVVT